jgi:hypothetical protein
MKIIIEDYPINMTFNTKKRLPIFQYGCEVRTALFHKMMRGALYTDPHIVTDFIVENVTRISKDCEIWDIGS